MSYEEKSNWVYLVVSTATYLVYVGIIVGRAGSGPLVDVPYLATLLWTCGIAMVANIVARILVEIAKPSDSHKADVRDKEVGRFGDAVAGYVLAVGMVGPFVLIALEADHFWAANAMYLVFVLHAVVGSAVKLVAYRRGL